MLHLKNAGLQCRVLANTNWPTHPDIAGSALPQLSHQGSDASYYLLFTRIFKNLIFANFAIISCILC